ncbi:MAG: type I-G CRISPR-associated helicase/endonuclease Cas3g [Acidimicrobiales bacterium]
MTPLTAADFPAFFEAVHGHEPFLWQAELVDRVMAGAGWPQGVDVPTGLGKTAVIDVAVFALAAQADLDPKDRTAPTRTFVVVDRRVIVDQSFERARSIADALLVDDAEPVVRQVAAALRSLSGGAERPLEVVRMRGGTTWGWRWLAAPAQPAVVVATVDQFGSRLLFRGYGVGQSLRSIDAALCGADSLLILDEAHLSQPLIDTMRAAGGHQRRAAVAVSPRPPIPPVLLSATLPPGIGAFRPDLDRETSPTARRRLDATRTASLVDLATPKDPGPDMARALSAFALDASTRGIERVAVVCNTVRMAREVFRLVGDGADGTDAALLVGRCRDVERQAVNETWLPRLQARDDRVAAGPVIAVATQTIEVGVDLDVDFLVTEAAPVDALLQRLGRLNRRGLRPEAEAVVVRAAHRHDDDPVYGKATGRTWEWLTEQAGRPEPVRATGAVAALERAPRIDLSPRTLAEVLTPERRRELAAEPPLSPVVLGPVLDGWARTSPSPVPDQPVAPYLHGISRPAADVQVCWRAGLGSPRGNLGDWKDELASAPVTSGEVVSVPIWEAKRFLAGVGDGGLVSDLEGAPDGDLDVDLDEREPIAAVVVQADGSVAEYQAGVLRPGDTIVLPSEAGGHDQWGWTGESGEFVADVADLVLQRRRRARLRLDVLVPPGSGVDRQGVEGEIAGLRAAGEEGQLPDHELLSQAITGVAAAVGEPDGGRLRALAGGSFRVVRVASRWFVVTGSVLPANGSDRARVSTRPPDDEMGDEDDCTSSLSSTKVTLEQHLCDVARLAQRQARLLGLSDVLVGAVELAGRMHDLGKADPRFQAMLHQGELEALASGELLAKSGMDPADRAAYHRARERSGWPRGMRHESVSAALVGDLRRSSPELFEGIDAELVAHLVQSHHGRARPLLPARADPAPRLVTVDLPGADARAEVRSDRDIVDWDGPARFARLGRRYGWWGLALLESIVRLADLAVSQSYEIAGRP